MARVPNVHVTLHGAADGVSIAPSTLGRATTNPSRRQTNRGDKVLRMSRYVRYSRHSRFVMRPDFDYRVRTPLSEYVSEALALRERALYFQRVYILARNNKEFPTLVEDDCVTLISEDFKTCFQDQLIEILDAVEEDSFTTDPITGMFVTMGDYSIIVVEGTEDMVGSFCVALGKKQNDYWEANRVFMVEDSIDDTYFRRFICRRGAQININEKFPPSTPTEIEPMREQHLAISEKLHQLCEALSAELREVSKAAISKQDLLWHGRSLPDLTLPPEEYNKLMPEVQRIDLVLDCTRFYRPLDVYSQIYLTMPRPDDEDLLIWPTMFNYTPVGVFTRSPYDVNLTFADYGRKEDDKSKERLDDETSRTGDTESRQISKDDSKMEDVSKSNQ